MEHCRLSSTILLTLAGFVEWIPISHIIAGESLLLPVLWNILEDDVLQLHAAECLLLIAGRKGKTEDRKPLLTLFSEPAMSSIYSAASIAADTSLISEQKYTFLKKLCQVLIALGGQLYALLGVDSEITVPVTFPIYLNTVLAFTKHPSQVLSSYTQNLWSLFFNHKAISEDVSFKAVIPQIVKSCMDKLIKVGFPSRSDFASCSYSKLDFDSDEDFNAFFGKFRSDVCETLRCATMANPIITFSYASEWLYMQLKKEPQDAENGFCSMTTPLYLEWEALANCLESVMGRILSNDLSKSSAEDGIKLLKAVLKYETQDPLILSCVISCISALHVFLTLAPELLLEVLEKLFMSVVFSQPGQTKATRSKAVKNVRRHACSFLVKICKQHPRLLLPLFDQIYQHTKNISSDPEQLSQMEKCTLMEALILLNNEFQDYNRQSAFLQETLGPVSSIWLSSELDRALSNVDHFMTHIGLNRAPKAPSNEDVGGINRSQMTYCVNTILGVIRRSKWPDDPDVARSGGFLCPDAVSAETIYFRNPATPHVYPLLKGLFSLIGVLNKLWIPENREKIHAGFTFSLDMLESEKNLLLPGLNVSLDNVESGDRQPCDRMQNFLFTIHDNCYHILGNAGPNLGLEFYGQPGLASQILTSVFADLHHVPDYRLRPIVRVFLKPFIQYCSHQYETQALIPVLQQLCPFVFQRLREKWSVLQQRYRTSSSHENDSSETQEVLEDQLTRQLSREYLDLLGVVMTGGKKNVEQFVEVMDEDVEIRPNPQSDVLSELGIRALKNKKICAYIVSIVFNALHWIDTLTCIKSIPLCLPILKQLMAENLIIQQQEASFFLECVLFGLKELGEHAANEAFLVGLGVQVYELLRPAFPVLRDVLSHYTECSPDQLQNFEDKILNVPAGKQLPDKRKKDMFRKLVKDIVGKNVGRRFSRPVDIRNLPRSPPRLRPQPPEMDHLGLVELFQPASRPAPSSGAGFPSGSAL
ncbi:exportin-5-like [Centruroides sculpturatus]|uniref:exportin-5-like n=1 Tax=Centruroides sculpturatus TaxID=218467 RepID=UPI000C6D4B22|nr:exportin-5-like [Centruroides sculpturatus]